MLLISLALALLACRAFALLEEPLVCFDRTSENDAVPIHDAAIVYSADDPVAVAIAAESLTGDFEAITGTRPRTSAINGSDWSAVESVGGESAIVVATIDSELVQDLVERE